MLLELDADQRLWQETVRDAVGKQCPPSLVRSVAEDGADASPLWKVYVDAGWTELTDPENAVELAIVLEELGRATDPTPFLATLTQYAPLVGERFDPQLRGHGRLRRGDARTATPTAGSSTAPPPRPRRGPGRAHRRGHRGRGVPARRRLGDHQAQPRSSTPCCTSPR